MNALSFRNPVSAILVALICLMPGTAHAAEPAYLPEGTIDKVSPPSQVINPAITSQVDPALAATDTWRPINNGLPSYNHVNTLVADPVDANIIYGGFSNDFGTVHGIYKTTDGGKNWLRADTGLPAAANIMSLVMDTADRHILYAINGQDELYKSIDQGGHWAKLTTLPEDVWCVAVNGANIYVGGYSTVYHSTDGGSTFNPTFAYPGNGTMNSLWVDPGDSSHVIAALGSSLSQTINSGHSWTAYSLSGCDTAYTVALAVDPANTQNMIVGTWFCLLRTTNGGLTWTDVHDIGYVNFIRYDANDDNLVYASSGYPGTSLLLKSIDGGDTWNNFDSGFPPSYQVAAMALGPSSLTGATHSAVYAGLSGRGIYTTDPELTHFKIWLPIIIK